VRTPDPAPELQPRSSVAFLLVQLGTHVAGLFGERLRPLGLEPRQAGMLVRLAQNNGRSQQAIAELMGLTPTRMVFLTDELEELGLVERRRNRVDRRSHALYLTEAGTAMLARVREVTRAHEAAITACLTGAERDQLTALLQRLADAQGLAGQSLPGMPQRHRPVSSGERPPGAPMAPGRQAPPIAPASPDAPNPLEAPDTAGDTGAD
jgi:DNA-binding MarR family transcriptional regulator